MKSIVIMKKNIYTTKKVLILAGGSIKGAFQAGAFQALIENGYRPDFIYGVSVGSLNGAFICNEAGKQDIDSVENLDWNLIAQNLTSFWARNIAQPADIAVRTKDVSLFAHILFERFHGLLNTTPIQNLIKKTIEVHNLKKSPIGFQAGAVNIDNGQITYVDSTHKDFIDYLLASSAIPIIMPVVNIGGDKTKQFVDGALRDVAPLRRAIENGAEEIVCILCHPENFEGGDFNSRNILQLSERIMDIAVNEIMSNDIEWVLFLRNLVSDKEFKKSSKTFASYKKIKLTIIRPQSAINLNLQKFNSLDIRNLMDLGYQSGKENYRVT